MIPKSEIDILAEHTLQEWKIPGLALAIIHKDTEYVQGYGIKKRGSKDKVDSRTLFQIASLTKAFTSYAISLLVEQGVLDWDVPILTYLPQFRVKDPVATSLLSLRDLLCHRTGLPGVSHEEARRFWYHTNRSTHELLERLAYVEPGSSFRAHFGYNDMPYVIAGEVIRHVTGRSWQEFCQSHIFDPLSMKRTFTSYAVQVQDKNVATGHLVQTQQQPIELLNWENMAAAGGISSCAQDMLHWLKFNLTPPSALAITHQPQTLFEVDGFMDPVSRPIWNVFAHQQTIVNYALGWMVYRLDNKTVLFHPSLSDGMQAVTVLVPEEKLGIMIFTNLAFQHGALCLIHQLIDYFFQHQGTDWHQLAHQTLATIEQEVQLKKKEFYSRYSTKEKIPLSLDRYVGEYTHPAYGSVWIRNTTDGKLEIELFSHEKGVLSFLGQDTFEITATLFQPALPWTLRFMTQNDQVQELSMDHFGTFKKIGKPLVTQEIQ